MIPFTGCLIEATEEIRCRFLDATFGTVARCARTRARQQQGHNG
jgi:hypothetical protein